MSKKIIVVGSGNAALCAGIAALENGAETLMLEKAPIALAGGNTKYTAGAMRFAYQDKAALMPLLRHPDDPKIALSDFDSYTQDQFAEDLLGFNEGAALSDEQKTLISKSYETLNWLAGHNVRFEPIYTRQSFEKNGRHIFWGGLVLAAENEGVGLYDMELAAFEKLGGTIRYETPVVDLIEQGGEIKGVRTNNETIMADAVILACGGFEASAAMRADFMGHAWQKAKVRGTPHNTGDGIGMARAVGAHLYGRFDGCHATPMDLHMKDFGNLDLPAKERKKYRKICYFLGVMLNKTGQRFVDEGKNFRNYTYAQFGRAVLEQPDHIAWQIFDKKVVDLLYDEYHFHDANYIEADTLDALIEQLEAIDKQSAKSTLIAYNDAVDDGVAFDPTVLDGKSTKGLKLNKTNWAQKLDKPPFRAYPVTGGITFTYGGVKVNDEGLVMHQDGAPLKGLYAAGEMVGGVFFGGYPGGSGLTSGAVFGRIAGQNAAKC